MFFLSEEERQTLLRGLLPKSREEFVNPELRGWNWDKPPLSPAHDVLLPLYQVAGRYCESGRDVYLRHVHRINPPASEPMVEGGILHEVIRRIFTRAKRLVYTLGVEEISRLPELLQPPQLDGIQGLTERIEEKARRLWDFEARRIIFRTEEILTKQPNVREDSLVFQALPIVLEQRIDGSFLGLSRHLSTDALIYAEPMIMEVKFGRPAPFHRLYTTGYALVMEALHGYPVNLGCLVYPTFTEGGHRITIQRELHFITDELRQWLVEQRDELARVILCEIDPGLPTQCYKNCHFWSHCHGTGPESASSQSHEERNRRAVERLRQENRKLTDKPSEG